MTLTVACVWVRGNVPFTSDYVAKLFAMVRRNMLQPFRFVCLTDRPDDLPAGIEPIVVETICPKRAWWTKLRLFDESLGLTGRVLYLDLDVLVLRPLDILVDHKAPLALAPYGESTWEGRDGLAVVKRFNSSVMVWNAGALGRLWHDWTPAVADRLWGDQDWIGEQCPDAWAMPAHWFPRLKRYPGDPQQVWDRSAKLVLCKKPKNAEAAKIWPWFRAAWG